MSSVNADASLTLTLDAQDNADATITAFSDHLAGVQGAIDAVSQSTAGLSGSAGPQLDSVGNDLAGVGEKAALMATQVEGSATETNSSFAGIGVVAQSAADLIVEAMSKVRMAAGAAGLAATAALIASSEGYEHYGNSISRVSFITNESVGDSERLLAAFRSQGLSADQAAGTLQRLERSLGNMADQQAKAAAAHVKSHTALDELGISTRNATGELIPMGQLMPQIIDKLNGMTDGHERARLAQQLFGRSWADLGTMVQNGGKAFTDAMGNADKFGLVIGKDGVDRAVAASMAHEQMKMALQGLTLHLGIVAMPLFERLTAMITAVAGALDRLTPQLWAQIGHWTALTAVFGTAWSGAQLLAKAGKDLEEVFPMLARAIEGVSGGLIKLEGGILAIVEHVPLLGDLVKPFAALFGPLGGVIALFFTLRDAYEKIGLVHIILKPLVDGVISAFHTLVGILESAWKIISTATDGWRAFNDIVAMAGQRLGIHRDALNSVQVEISRLHGWLSTILGPLGVWNEALLKGHDPLRATADMLATYHQRLATISPPLATLAGALSNAVNAFRRFHDLGLAVSVLVQSLGGSVQQGVEVWHAMNAVASTASGLWNGLKEVFTTFVAVFSRTHDLGLAVSVAVQQMGGSVQQGVAVWHTMNQVALYFTQVAHLIPVALAAVEHWIGVIARATMPALHSAMVQLGPVMVQLHQAFVAATPVIQALLYILGVLGVVILMLVGGAFQAIVSGLAVLLPTAINFAVGAIKVFVDVFSLVANVVGGVITIIADLLQGKWGAAWEAAKQLVVNFVRDVWRLVGDLVTTVTGLFDGLGRTVFAIVGGFVAGILGAFQNLYDQAVGHSIIPDLIRDIVKWFTSLPAQVLQIIWGLGTSAGTAAAGLGSSILNGITGALANLGGALGGAINAGLATIQGLVGAFAGAGSSIGNAIWTGAVNALSGLGGALKGAISSAKWALPGPMQDALGMLGLAEGGIVGPGFGGPRVAMIGEGRSAEAVTPLDRLPGLMAQAMQMAGGFGGGGRQEIILRIDSRDLARVVLDRAGDRWKLMGGTVGSGA